MCVMRDAELEIFIRAITSINFFLSSRGFKPRASAVVDSSNVTTIPNLNFNRTSNSIPLPAPLVVTNK